jgi:hypothetical protein
MGRAEHRNGSDKKKIKKQGQEKEKGNFKNIFGFLHGNDPSRLIELSE